MKGNIPEEQQAREQELRLIIDSAPILIFYKDKDGKFLRVNKAFAESLKMPEKEFVGKTVFDLFPTKIAQAMTDDDQEVIKSGRPKLNIIEQYGSASGTRWVQTDKVPLFDKDGSTAGLIGFAQDITTRKEVEETLGKSEERYRTILEETAEGYYETDLAGNYTFFNDVICKKLGYSREELTGMSFQVHAAPEDTHKIYEAYSEVYRTGKPLKWFPPAQIRKDGMRIFAEDSVSLLRNERGEIIGFRGVSRDITERKQAEEALRQSEEKYRTILDDIQEGYWEVDIAGNFTFFNDAICHLLGYSKKEIKGINYRDYTSAEDVDKVYKAFNQIYQTGKSIRNMHYEIIRKDGGKRLNETSVFPRRDDKGEIIGFRGVSHDATERLQMEKLVEENEAKFRSIVETTREWIWQMDLDGNMTYNNPAFEKILGYNPEELLGRNTLDYMHQEDRQRIEQMLQQLIPEKRSWTNLVVRWRHKDGTFRWLESNAVPILDSEGQMLGYQGADRDITERKQAEEALRQSEEKYQTIMEEMQESYFEVDLAGNYTLANEANTRNIGYPREEIIGLNYKAYTAAEDVDKVYEAFNQVLRTGKPSRDISFKVIRKNGGTGQAEVSVFPLKDEEGKIIGFRGVGHDVTERMRVEEALRQSEEKHRSVLESMDESYYEVDHAGNFTFFNDALCHQLGYSKEEMIGMNYKVYTPPDKVKEVFQAYNHVYRTGEPSKLFDMEQIRKDGTRLVVENSILPLRDEKGDMVGFRGVGREVTERLQAEKALKESEERYRTIMDEMREAYFEVDLAGNYTIFNDAQCRQLGYSREEMAGMSYKTLTPPDKVKEVFEIYNRIYRTGEPNELFQSEQIRKDGKRISVEYCAFPIRNEKGEITGFRGVGRDITERIQMIEALRQSEERYRTVLEDMEEAYYELDIAGNFTLFNNALCHQLGYSREELIGMNYKVYTPPEMAKEVFEAYNRVYRTGEPLKSFPMERIRKDGTRIFAETSGLALRDNNGKIIGFRGIIRDVTERKRSDQERRELEQKAQLSSRLASVGELASGVAHEINNPLTGVIGYAHLILARKDIPRDMIRDVEVINEGAQRVSNIVKKLLAFARQTRPEQRYVNINDLIHNTLELQAYALAANNIKVSLQLARDLPMTIADPGQLQQVFLNLIMNAETEMKLTRNNGKLSIKTEHADNTIRISFKDNGPGIKKENLESIFNPFFTTREVGQGTGLGLSVCHGIITEHKGRIWAESEPSKGATFIIELPVVTEDKQLEIIEPVIIEEPKKVGKAKILVVDDEPVVRQLVSKVLTDEGHEVETADNAADALAMVKNKRYRLILLDIKMPGMSGVELYKQFQEIAPSLTKRVVFITGDVMGKRTMGFLDKTKVPCIMKPFDAKQLKTEIKRILARK